jgi:hypothetical protein
MLFCAIERKDAPQMLAIIAAILFVIAFLLHATSTSTNVVFDSTSLLLVGLACLALHQAGVGTTWYSSRRRSRR